MIIGLMKLFLVYINNFRGSDIGVLESGLFVECLDFAIFLVYQKHNISESASIYILSREGVYSFGLIR